MKQLTWRVAQLGIVTLVTILGATPVYAQTTRTDTALEGVCRQTNRTLDVFENPSVNLESRSLATLKPDVQVILTGEITSGWVQISQPTEGYVIARHLKPCPIDTADATPEETPEEEDETSPERPVGSPEALENIKEGRCRRAITDLAIRSRPEAGLEPSLGSVREGRTATLTGNTSLDEDERIWLEISAPVAGWISGGRDGGSNLVLCE
ncbi:SH3 domain-containing protein [Spirulina sp. CS-785/01]|uniref:SH3 domain-containing protein n=1 Tax=Spirulina sp. CS-785/01 TaxID=3021716 RepID=UPI00232C7448|nr:SH3 domain-containing protein [Spirulina sp. CS-785/01]MDB9312883.1 SH3 domain-containing protein [Spirulina sp. CS-785/01]